MRAALDSDADRPRVFSAFVERLAARPPVVVFEDLHWADGATLDLLRHVGRRIAHTRSLLIATCRDDERACRARR